MAHHVPTLLRKMMEALPGNQTQLAERLSTRGMDIPQPQVSRWLRGQKPEVPAYERIVQVAKQLRVLRDTSSEDVASGIGAPVVHDDDEQPQENTIAISGFVSAGGQVKLVPLPAGELDRVPAPAGSNELTQCLEIRGDSLGEFFDRWLVFYDDIRSPVTPDLIGKLCVIGLADERVVIKKIKRERGDYILLSNGEDPIRGAIILWAARVLEMKPR
jgi:hypothetical protein